MNRANARGFAMDIKLIAKPLMVKTQAKQQPVSGNAACRKLSTFRVTSNEERPGGRINTM
jgi:hypothetical protein